MHIQTFLILRGIESMNRDSGIIIMVPTEEKKRIIQLLNQILTSKLHEGILAKLTVLKELPDHVPI